MGSGRDIPGKSFGLSLVPWRSASEHQVSLGLSLAQRDRLCDHGLLSPHRWFQSFFDGVCCEGECHFYWRMHCTIRNGSIGTASYWMAMIKSFWLTVISLSTQYKREQLYFCISNISHRRGLIAMHCTNAVPPVAYMSLHDRSLTLRIQVTPFTQHCFNTEQLVHDLHHSQPFRWRLIEPAAIHMQRRSQILVKPAPPPYYCDDIVVLFIVLYCITIAAVSRLTHPVAGTTSHMTHRATHLSSQVASLYSLLFSVKTFTYKCSNGIVPRLSEGTRSGPGMCVK